MTEARKVLADADDHAKRANDAESARSRIRLGEQPVMSRGWLLFRKRYDWGRDLTFTIGETCAIYEALTIVEREHRVAAERLEATLSVATGDSDE